MKIYLVSAAIAMFLAAPAVAHHNWAAIYDVNSDIEIQGVVSEIQWRNPHIRVSFTVDAGTANEKVYTTESNSVASLTRMNVTPELLAVGTQVRVAGYRSRTLDNDIFMNHLLLPDNREVIFLRTAEPRWNTAERVGNTDRAHGRVVEEDFSKRPTSVFGVWTTIFGAEGSHQAMGAPIDWTEKALAMQAVAAANPAAEVDECAPRGGVSTIQAPYPMQLIDNGDTVVIHTEFFDSMREVHMNTPHRPPEIPGFYGYSTGYFVGDTLVVTTSLGEDQVGAQVHETFHLSADHNRLQYTQIVVDPEMRTTPTMNQKWWQYQPGAFVQPYDCD